MSHNKQRVFPSMTLLRYTLYLLTILIHHRLQPSLLLWKNSLQDSKSNCSIQQNLLHLQQDRNLQTQFHLWYQQPEEIQQDKIQPEEKKDMFNFDRYY
jgi:hypothetical protein